VFSKKSVLSGNFQLHFGREKDYFAGWNDLTLFVNTDEIKILLFVGGLPCVASVGVHENCASLTATVDDFNLPIQRLGTS